MTHRERARAILQASYNNHAPGWHIGKVQDALTEALAAVERETLERAALICGSLVGMQSAHVAARQIRALKAIQVTQGNGVREQGGLAAADASLPGPSEAAEESGGGIPSARTVPSSAASLTQTVPTMGEQSDAMDSQEPIKPDKTPLRADETIISKNPENGKNSSQGDE